MKKLFLFLSVMVLASCGNNESEEPVVSQKPKFEIKKEMVYIGEHYTYSDVLKPYYYHYTVTQTNPNATVSQERLKEMEDSVNYDLELSDERKDIFYLKNTGIEINGKAVDIPMVFSVEESKIDKYVSLGKNGLMDIWKKSQMLCLFTTFQDYQGLFDIRMRTRPGAEYDDLYIDFRQDWAFGDYVEALDYFNLVDEKPTSEPTINLTEYYWTYDRFNDRKYWDDEGNSYTTKVVVKRMEDVKGYDHSIKNSSESWSAFDWYENYPVIQIYKEDELWFEGKINKYTEEHTEREDGIDTILTFYAATKRDGYYWQFSYEWVGYSRFILEKLDFTKPTEHDEFTEVETIKVRIVKDEKEGHKGTGSFDNGKGKTFNYND